MCAHRHDYHPDEPLPDWTQKTLAKHAAAPREFLYELEEFEQTATHDPLWSAAQRQLLREGIIHNDLRMLWGKEVLEWTSTPRQALEIMIELNNKYAIDGRDSNSYSGIFGCWGVTIGLGAGAVDLRTSSRHDQPECRAKAETVGVSGDVRQRSGR